MTDTRKHTPAFPDQAAELSAPGPTGALECLVDYPPAEQQQPALAIICHPHPEHGGTMRNKVVTIIERALRELGLVTLRFNYRGVGESAGSFDDGEGELQDLLTLAAWARAAHPDKELWLAGFSFGAWVTSRAAATLEPRQLISIAPPVGRMDFAAPQVPGCHWLIIQGEDDDVVNANDVRKWAESLQPQPQLLVMPEAGHFFHRRLMDLRGLLKNTLRDKLPAPG